MSDVRPFRVEVTQERDFAFKVDFGLDGVDEIVMDEPEPVGNSKGPNATMALAAAIGNCLCASLLFCLRKSRVNVLGVKATVKGSWVRNKEGRWRIMEIEVEITPKVDEDHIKQLERCTDIFESFCVVSQSVKEGIAIDVKVRR